MIDTSKQYIYIYNGKPVRIYADGSDCSMGHVHGAYQNQEGGTWYIKEFSKYDLIEVWQPKEAQEIIIRDKTTFMEAMVQPKTCEGCRHRNHLADETYPCTNCFVKIGYGNYYEPKAQL